MIVSTDIVQEGIQGGNLSISETRSAAVLDLLKNSSLAAHIDFTIPLPRPFVGSGPIRLVVVGQDPTIRSQQRRKHVKTALNMNRQGALRRYVGKICSSLELDLDAHVYATNLCKSFFAAPPADNPILLREAAAYWLPVLQVELKQFPDAVVVTLGEPLLRLLLKEGVPLAMSYYWGYDQKWRDGVTCPLHGVGADESVLGRCFFPIIHQPSSRKAFYASRFNDYMAFVKCQARSPLGATGAV